MNKSRPTNTNKHFIVVKHQESWGEKTFEGTRQVNKELCLSCMDAHNNTVDKIIIINVGEWGEGTRWESC